MPKRFTDSSKWFRPWFRKLTPEHKVFWFYLLDNCDAAGIWHVDFELASIMIGGTLNEADIRRDFAKQIQEIDEGKRWFIQDFIPFQYNCSLDELNPANKAHLGVIRILDRYSLRESKKRRSFKGPSKVLPSTPGVRVGTGAREQLDKQLRETWFEEIWKGYPKKLGKADAQRHFNATVKTEEDFGKIKQALSRYRDHIRVNHLEVKFIQHGKTWFNNWTEWIDYVEPEQSTKPTVTGPTLTQRYLAEQEATP